MHENNVAHRFVAFVASIHAPNMTISDCTQPEILRLTRRICILKIFTLLTWIGLSIFAERPSGTHERVAPQNTSSLTLAFTVDMIPPMGRHSTRQTIPGWRQVGPRAPGHEEILYPYLGNLVREEYIQVCVVCLL